MKILNVIEFLENVPIGITTFLIGTGENNPAVSRAEELFLSLIATRTGWTLSAEDKEYYLDEGHYTDGDYGVALSWSEAVHS